MDHKIIRLSEHGYTSYEGNIHYQSAIRNEKLIVDFTFLKPFRLSPSKISKAVQAALVEEGYRVGPLHGTEIITYSTDTSHGVYATEIFDIHKADDAQYISWRLGD